MLFNKYYYFGGVPGTIAVNKMLMRLGLKKNAWGRWIETSIYFKSILWLFAVYFLYTPPMMWNTFAAPYHPPFVHSTTLMFLLQLIALVTHIGAVCTLPTHLPRNATHAQLDAAYKAAGISEGAPRSSARRSEGSGELRRVALTKFDTNVGARIPVRFTWCATCNFAVLRRDHHCNWIRNCVGLGNAFVFHCYITTVVISTTLFGYSSAVYVAAHVADMLKLVPLSLVRRAAAWILAMLLRVRDPLHVFYTAEELLVNVGLGTYTREPFHFDSQGRTSNVF